MFNGNGEGLGALSGGNDAAAAVGLFDEVLVLFYPSLIGTIELLIPLYRPEISRGEQHSVHSGNRNRLDT